MEYWSTSANAEVRAAIIALPHLRRLTLLISPHSPFTAEDIGRLTTTELVDLELDYSGASLSDDDLKYVATHSKLERLSLTDTNISDAGLAHLAPLENLRFLNLEATNVSGVGLSQLRCSESLTMLVVTGDALSDEGLGVISQFPNITKLIVAGRNITEEGLEQLLALKHLQHIMIGDIRPTPHNVMRRLAREIPCHVSYSYTLKNGKEDRHDKAPDEGDAVSTPND